jgi:YD repeat-containing protein
LTHSLLGQLEQIAGTGSSSAQTLAVSYSYDLRGRLTGYSKTYHADATHVYTKSGSYSYDLSNNLNGGAGWTYNRDNQLTSAPPLGDLPGATNLTYGLDGTLSTLNNHSFSYDPWGDLSSVTNTSAGTLSFTYDSDGDWVSKSSTAGTIAYLYDGDTLLAQTDGNGNLTVSYNWGPDGLLSDFSGTAGRYYEPDPEGDTSALLDDNGNTLA